MSFARSGQSKCIDMLRLLNADNISIHLLSAMVLGFKSMAGPIFAAVQFEETLLYMLNGACRPGRSTGSAMRVQPWRC